MIAIPFILNTLASFLVGLLVAKFLGPAEYGRYAIAMAIGIVWQTIGFDWLRLSATRFTLAGERAERPEIAATLQALFLVLSAFTVVVAQALFLAPDALPLPPALLALAALVALANGTFDYSSAVLRARFLDRPYRTLVLARTLLSLVLILGGAYVFKSAEMALAGLVLSMIGAAALANSDIIDREATPRRALKSQAASFAFYALPIVAANGLYQLAPLMNRSLAGHALGFAQAGQLSLAYDMGLRIVAAIGSSVDVLLFQLAVRAEKERGLEAAKAQVGFNVGAVFAMVAPAVVGCWLVLPSFEALLIPEAFRGPFAHYFALQLPAFLCFALTMYCVGPMFQIVHRTWPVALGGAAALAANALVVNLSPVGADASIYAMAQSISSFAGFVVVAALAAITAPVRISMRDILSAALAAAAMALVGLPLRAIAPGAVTLAEQIALGGSIYGAAAFAFDLCGLRTMIVRKFTLRRLAA